MPESLAPPYQSLFNRRPVKTIAFYAGSESEELVFTEGGHFEKRLQVKRSIEKAVASEITKVAKNRHNLQLVTERPTNFLVVRRS